MTKQPTVSRSNAKSAYSILADACAETIWLSYLLQRLRYLVSSPVILYCDNLSTTYIAANPVFHACTKHIELDYHFVWKRAKLGTHSVQFFPRLIS